MAGLQFATFSSQIELPFYTSLFASKLDHDKLDDSARYVLGLYEAKGEKDPTESTRMQLFANALTSNTVPLHMQRAEGIIRNFNTIEDFKQADKAAILQTAGRQIWDAIKDGTIYEIPSLLSSFNIISFADLKKYKFTYWVAYPALHSDPQWKRVGDIGKLTLAESGKLNEQYTTFRYANDVRQRGFFLAKKVSKAELAKQKEAAKRAKRSDEEGDDESRYHDDDGDDDDGFEDDDDDGLDFKWVVGCLRDFEKGFFDGVEEKDRFVGFVDSSSYPENPSWPLRNLLVLIRQRFHMTKVQILCYRDTRETRHESRSIILPLAMEDVDELEISSMPKITGWERNAAGKLAARVVNLGEYMDPNRLADQAVDLNLKLMKWRLTPTLDLDVIKNTRCLLLGSGTLGSYVSRNLMGWGVRKITFVDNGSVSFSNPVRQPLFEFKDCLKGGAPKALRAAEALQQIFPGVESEGHVLSVPMLGHPIVDEAKTKKDFEKLEELIDDHDVIFLLMDTRESRWLPTVMGKAKGKIVMNAALGFDTFVVMRHGAAPKDGSEDTLGCYFCNDVVAPADSVKDQTLDQQCTVTRPGVATIASALLVELMTSILQHPQKHYAAAPVAKADSSFERDPEDHALGIVPHQIRGFLANFHNMLIRGQSYPNCSACSKPILDAFKQDSWGFVKRALENRDYVAEVSGLKEIQERAEAMAADLEWSEEEGTSDGEAVVL